MEDDEYEPEDATGRNVLIYYMSLICTVLFCIALESVRYGVDIQMWGHGTDVIVCVIISTIVIYLISSTC